MLNKFLCFLGIHKPELIAEYHISYGGISVCLHCKKFEHQPANVCKCIVALNELEKFNLYLEEKNDN